MAKRTITQLVSDLSGKEIKDGDGETVKFSIGSAAYELDLTSAEAGKFYDDLKKYTDKATKISGRNPRTGAQVPVPERRVVTFRPGKKMKEMVSSTTPTAESAETVQPPRTPEGGASGPQPSEGTLGEGSQGEAASNPERSPYSPSNEPPIM